MEEVFLQQVGGGWSYGGNSQLCKVPAVEAELTHAGEQTVDSVGRGQHQPVERFESAQSVVQPGEILRRRDLDGGALHDVRPAGGELLCQLRCLLARSGYEDSLAKQGKFLLPCQLVVERHHFADNQQRRRADVVGLGRLCRGRQRRDNRSLCRQRGVLDQGDRCFARPAGGDESCGDGGQVAHAHVEHQRVQTGKGVVVDGGCVLAGVLVAGDEGNRRGQAPVGQGYSRAGARGNRGCDAGDDSKRQPCIDECVSLLAASSEDQRIPAL